MSSITDRKFVALDGLRAFCAFAVILVHTANSTFHNGSIGVDVFFVLSGFLITGLLLREYETGSVNLTRFYLRRSARLWPALLLLIVVWCVYTMVRKDASERNEQLTAAVWAGFYVMNWVRALTQWPQGDFGHTWSLAIEEQFYLIWPLALGLLLKLRPARRRMTVAAMIAGVVAWRFGLGFLGATPERLFNGFDTRADALLAGCLLGLMSQVPRIFELARRTWLVPAALLVAATLMPRAQTVLEIAWSFPLVVALATWLIAGLRDATSAPLVSHPWVIYVGRISYGIYLWHYPITLALVGHFKLSEPGAVVVVTALSVACAAASFHIIEGPFRRRANAWLDLRAAAARARHARA